MSIATAVFVLSSAQVMHATVPADLLYVSLLKVILVLDLDDGTVKELDPPLDDASPYALYGITFDSTGRLIAGVARCGDPCHLTEYFQLVELDPLTGAVVEEIGHVRDASGSSIILFALSAKPGSDLLYGLGNAYFYDTIKLWSIDPATGAATLIGSPAGCPESGCPRESSGLAFGPDGTLHATLAWPPLNERLWILDEGTGAQISSRAIDGTIYGQIPLAVRSDGTLFSHSAATKIPLPRPCRTCPPPDPPFEFAPPYVATIDESTGAITNVAPGFVTPEGYPPFDLAFSPLVFVPIDIDVRPGNAINPINPKSHGVVPVAILGSETFDVADVDVTTLTFGPGGAPPAYPKGEHRKDANHDGIKDLLTHFHSEESGIVFGQTEACVMGELLDGTPFRGCDSIVTLPPGCGDGFEMALMLPACVWLRRRRTTGVD